MSDRRIQTTPYLPIQFEHEHDEEDQGEDPGQQNPLSQRHVTDCGHTPEETHDHKLDIHRKDTIDCYVLWSKLAGNALIRKDSNI